MKVAKEAIKYYCVVTGNDYSEFYTKLDGAISAVEKDDEQWLISKLVDVIVASGTSIEELKANKDTVKMEFDNDTRVNAGEYYTPEDWCAEARKYFDKYIPNWGTDYAVYDGSCYPMNTEIFIRTPKTPIARKDIKETEELIDGQLTFICGWVTPENLRGTDQILTLDPRNNETQKWCGYYNFFTKMNDDVMIRMYFDADAMVEQCKDPLEFTVTPDHTVWVGSEAFGGYRRMTAQELYDFWCSHDYDIWMRDRDGLEYLLSEAEIVNSKEKVWDLTTYNDNHIFLVRQGEMEVFSGNCGVGNLMRSATNHKRENLYYSSLQQDDIDMLKSNQEFEGATIFQLDFLEGIDYDMANLEFFDRLPDNLKDIIKNDKPLIFYMNPPYKAGSAAVGTDVNKYMQSIGLGRSSNDLYNQFMWRVMSLVDEFNLSNCYFGCFGPTTFFTNASSQPLVEEFEHCFEFIDGMCLAAYEFSDIGEGIQWSIAFTLWKARGGYMPERVHKDIVLERKGRNIDNEIITESKDLYAPPRMKLSEWVKPKDVVLYDRMPLMTSHLTFKGGVVNEKIARRSDKLAKGALGTIMTGNNMSKGSEKSAIMSMPSSLQYVSITEENFWRCVASFSFRRWFLSDWTSTKKELSAPSTTVEGYDIWLRNALISFIAAYKSLVSSLRDVDFEGRKIDIHNKLFFISPEEAKAGCHDPRILEDIEKNSGYNTFMLQQIEESKPYWYPEVLDLYNFCKEYVIFTYDKRKDFDYVGSTECWDASIQQLRGGVWDSKIDEMFTEKYNKVREIMRKDMLKFGFIEGV